MKSFDIKRPVEKVEAPITPELKSVEQKRLLGWFSLESMKEAMHNKYVKIGAVVLSVLALGYGAKLAYESYNDKNLPANNAEENVCAPTWLMRGNGHNNGDFVEGGVDGIKEVKGEVDPKDVLYTWLDKIDDDRTTLDFVAEEFHQNADKKDVNIDKNSLTDIRGCATDTTVREVNYIKNKIREAKVNYGLAPVDGVNSYVTDKGEVSQSKVTEREAIIIDFHNGEKLYIVGICGNVVDEREYTIIKESKEKKTVIKKHHDDDKKDKKDKLEKKSADSKDYQKPGSDTKKDSGSGTKPKVESSSSSSPVSEVETNRSTPSNEGSTNSGTVTD